MGFTVIGKYNFFDFTLTIFFLLKLQNHKKFFISEENISALLV